MMTLTRHECPECSNKLLEHNDKHICLSCETEFEMEMIADLECPVCKHKDKSLFRRPSPLTPVIRKHTCGLCGSISMCTIKYKEVELKLLHLSPQALAEIQEIEKQKIAMMSI